jgi:hypothetical protein
MSQTNTPSPPGQGWGEGARLFTTLTPALSTPVPDFALPPPPLESSRQGEMEWMQDVRRTHRFCGTLRGENELLYQPEGLSVTLPLPCGERVG